MKYSIIVPVFNRPDEVNELLESLTHQTVKDFEVVIVEDGSQTPCKDVCEQYKDMMDIHYYYKENSGPGQSRNYGAERASGEYLLILDSDVVLPENYLKAVSDELSREPADAFGGPDKAHSSFTDTQKAISYSMTSFFTTGGIRGGKKKMDKFYPRSFNMGIRRDVYLKLNGFPTCVSEKTSTSLSVSSRQIAVAVCSLRHGYGTSAAPTSASFGDKSIIAASHASTYTKISRKSEARPLASYGLHRGSDWHALTFVLRFVAIYVGNHSCIPYPRQCHGSIRLHRLVLHPTLFDCIVHRQHPAE